MAAPVPPSAPALPAVPAHFVKGPYLQDLDAHHVEVRFEVSPAVPARLELLGGPTARATESPAGDFHELDLDGLAPATSYHARVTAGTAHQDVSFTTAPADTSTAPLSFLVYGDNRTDPVAHAAVVRAMSSAPGDFLVNTGDMVQDGSDPSAWQRFFDVEALLLRDRCLFAAVGNHEIVDESATNFLRFFGASYVGRADAGPSGGGELAGARLLYRSVRWGPARFFFLNGMDTFVSGAERAWLEQSLAAADHEPGVTWRIVVVHHGPWSSGPHGPNPRLAAAHMPDAWRAHHVDLVLSGHDHIYERGAAGRINYLISGGGGAPLYRVKALDETAAKVESTLHFIEAKIDGRHFAMTVRRADASVLERCGFDQRDDGAGPWTCDAEQTSPTSPAVSGAPASAGPSTGTSPAGGPTSPSSRCACDLVGRPLANGRAWAGWALALAAGLVSAGTARRRRRARARLGELR